MLWQLEEQRHMSRGIVEEDSMSLFAVFSESFAMVTHHDDQRVPISVLALEITQQVSQCGVRVGYLTVVQTIFVDLRVRRRRLIGVMRIVKMDPDKARFL